MSLETHFFAKQLQKYKNGHNKVDKNLAAILLDAVDAIAEFLVDAQISEEDEKADVLEIIPSIENDICQAHRYYYCKACNQSVRASSKAFTDHFYGHKHLKKLRDVDNSMGSHEKPKKSLKMKAALNGSTQSLNSLNSDQATTKLSKKERLNSLPSPIPRNKALAPDTNLPKKVRDFLSTQDLDDYTVQLLSEGAQIKNSQVFQRVCQTLQNQLSRRYPQVKVYPFGSIIIGLGKQGGDLDIFVDIAESYFSKMSKRRMKDAIHMTKNILAHSPQWDSFEPVVHARTPILRVFYKSEKIDCDLSFSNGLSCCNTILIGYFIDLQPVCKKLTAFVKSWASELQLGINSYLISLMIIFYLQIEGLLPSVMTLQKGCKPAYIDGWRSNFAQMSLVQIKMPMATDFKKYLLGFFRFYGCDFDYDKHIVSVLTGTLVEKNIFDHGKEDELPEEFERFKTYMAKVDLDEADEVEDLFSNRKPFVIQDPFELCHNVSKGVHLSKLNKIINFMRQSHEILSARKLF
jgi:predicted nucleotidyltransferase